MVKLMEATLQIQSTPWANLSIRGRLLTTKLRLEPLQPKDSTMTQRQNESRPVGASFNLTNEVNDDRGLGNHNGTETNGSESRKEPTNQPNGDLNGSTDNQNSGQKRSNGNNSNDDDDDSGNNSEDENPRPPKRPKNFTQEQQPVYRDHNPFHSWLTKTRTHDLDWSLHPPVH